MSSIQTSSLGKFLGFQTLHEGAGSASAVCPFDVTLTAVGNQYRFTTHPGTVNGLLVNNYATGILIPNSGTYYIVVRCTTSNGTINGATFVALSSPPEAVAVEESAPPSTFDVLIAVVINGRSFKVWTCGNILASSTESFKQEKVGPNPGELPYTIWYTWSITAT